MKMFVQRTPDRTVSYWLRKSLLASAMAVTVSAVATLTAFQPFAAYAQEDEMTQNFQDVDISKVIEAVAKISGKNFVIDPRVKGKVTLIAPEGMEPDALYETLLAVLDVHGYVAIPSDNVTKIVPANLAKDKIPYRHWKETEEDWVTEVLSVRHVEATKLVAILRPMVAREGHLVALAESNKLILTDTVANIQRIKSILKRIDQDINSEFEVVQIQHAPAVDLAKTLKSLLPRNQGSSGLQFSVDERSNRIVLSGEKDKRMQIRALLAELDIPVNANGRLEVVYLRYAKAADMLPVLQDIAENTALLSLNTQNLSEPVNPGSVQPQEKPDRSTSAPSSDKPGAVTDQEPPTKGSLDKKELKSQIRIVADERMNALVISAPSSVTQNLKEVIRQLDVRRAQVLIEAVFVEISEDKVNELGVEWGAVGSTGAGLISFSGALSTILGNLDDPATAASGLSNGINLAGGELNGNNRGWGALLQALNSDSASNILATPSILTLDNEEAEILVGREVPFQTGSYTSTTNSVSNPFSTIERESVGLKLKVKPQINEGNEIYLDIDQEVSDVLPKGEAVDIQTTKRQIKTRVIVGDGNVVVLGGLIDEKETEVDSRVPLLGDIPGIGELFRSRESSREKVNLMVFLRPLIIRDNAMSDYYSQQKYSYIYDQQKQLLENPLSGWQREGLRPQLPTLQQWKDNRYLTVEPKTVHQTKSEDNTPKAPLKNAEEASHPADRSLDAFEELTSDF